MLRSGGEPKEAARLGNDALGMSRGAVIQPVLVRAREVGRALQRWKDIQEVSDLGSHLAEISRRPRTEG